MPALDGSPGLALAFGTGLGEPIILAGCCPGLWSFAYEAAWG